MNWLLKKHSKWFIVVVTIFIAVVIAIINYKQSYTALTLIPSVLLAFLQSNEKQEKLAEMQIEEIEKEQKEKEEQKRFNMMLEFVFNSYVNNNEEAIKMFDKKIDLGKYLSLGSEPKYEKMTLKLLKEGTYPDDYGRLIMSWNQAEEKYRPGGSYAGRVPNSAEQKKIFYKCLEVYSFKREGGNKSYKDILKEELPKILNDDDFDKEQLI